MASVVTVAWRHRPLLWSLIRRDLQNRYAGSLAGMGWALLQPLAMLAVYGVVFEYVFKVRTSLATQGQPYVLFVAAALWPWLAFQEGVSRGVQAIQSNAAIVKKVSFPLELLVLSSVTASFIVQLCGFVFVLTMLSLWGMQLQYSALPLVVLAMGVLYLFTIAMVYVLAALQVYLRDVEQVVAQVMSALFYLTPILYSTTAVPAWMKAAMQWNPLVHVIEPLREALLGLGATQWNSMLLTLAIGGVLVAAARRFFCRLARYFEDVL